MLYDLSILHIFQLVEILHYSKMSVVSLLSMKRFFAFVKR